MTHNDTTPPPPGGPDNAPEMSWYAWGDPERATPLDPGLRDLVSQALNAELRDMPPIPEEQVELPPFRLAEHLREALVAVVGAEHVRTDDAVRLRCSGGKSTPDLLLRRAGKADSAPDAVVLPADHDQVQRLLEVCSAERIAVVPFGGGTSVVGGVTPVRDGFSAVITLDLRRLDRLVSFDPVSLTAALEAGVRGPRAEELLAARGCTLGHLPQSHEYASIGEIGRAHV